MKRRDDEKNKRQKDEGNEEKEELDELDVAKIVEARLNANYQEEHVPPIASASAAAMSLPSAMPQPAARKKRAASAKAKASASAPFQPLEVAVGHQPTPASVPGAVRRGVGTYERITKPDMSVALGRGAEPSDFPATTSSSRDEVAPMTTPTPESEMCEFATMEASTTPHAGIPVTTNTSNFSNSGSLADPNRELHHESPSKLRTSYVIAGGVVLVLIIVGIVVGIVVGSSSSSVEKSAGNPIRTKTLEDVFSDPKELGLVPQSTRTAIESQNQQLPQVQAFQWLVGDPRLEQYGPQQLRQRLALATFYFATDGPNWFADANETSTPSNLWLDYETHECFWLTNWKASFAKDNYPDDENTETIHVCDDKLLDVTVTSTDLMGHFDYHVISLSSYKGNSHTGVASPVLTGSLVGELAMLTQLQELTIESQQIKGTIPSELVQLSSTLTHISLESSFFTGDIPSAFFTFPALLWLSDNERLSTTSVPTTIGTSLTSLKLANVGDLTGATIPSDLFATGNLNRLDLSGNRLEGTIPSEIGTLGNSLCTLRLADGRLSGTLPTELGNLVALESFTCSSNQISGSLPKEFAALTNLERFSCFENRLTGTIPAFLFSTSSPKNEHSVLDNDTLVSSNSSASIHIRSSLRVLSLASNKLMGTLTTEIGLAVNLTMLDLYNNDLDQFIPSEIGMLARLEDLDVGRNKFAGPVPTELGLLESLTRLFLAFNDFVENLPSELGQLAGLEVLNFYGSGISGSLPTELGRLLSLTQFIAADNALTGSVPSELGLLANLREIVLSGTDLVGELPTELGLLSQLTALETPNDI